jgi:hypothetical protein
MLAAYYFGATRVSKDLGVIVDYLATIGQRPEEGKWWWLAQAAFIAQHRMYDFDLALSLAYKVVQLPDSDNLPQWARQMPAFVLARKGDKESARLLMEEMLLTQKNLSREEINNAKFFLINTLGVSAAEVNAILRKREGR